MTEQATMDAGTGLGEGFKGVVIAPGDPGYDDARAVWNGSIDKRPALIVRPLGAADVIDAVNYARAKGLPLAVRCGGHSVAGNGTVDGGVLVDLSRLKGVHVDPEARTARVNGGVLVGELDRETQLFGLATPSGRVTTTGVGGFTLGGGYGWLSPKFGLACDNLLSAEVVTADGRLVTAGEHQNDDLLWGLRGGSGNFGVATSYEFRLHPLGPTVLAGLLVHPIEEAKRLIRAGRDYVESAPQELVTATGILQAPPAEFIPPHLHGRPVLGLFVLYIGRPDEGGAVVAPLKELGPPAADLVAPMPYTAFQAMVDPFAPPGMLNYHRGIHLSGLPDEAIDAYVDLGTEIALVSSPTTQAILFRHGGAVSQPAELAGDLAEAATTWREVADGRRRGGDPARLGTARRRLAAVLELQGRWPEALAARDQAAVAFTAAGLDAAAAAERLAAAAHLRSAGSFRAALSLLETAGEQARAAGRVDLQARILGQEGNVRARMGRGHDAVELVRAGLAMALEHGLTGPAAEIYQRLADSVEHTGDYPAAKETYDQAFGFCSANALEPTAQLCLACLTVVLRQTGDWDRAVPLCRQVIASTDATLHARAVATGMLGSILGHRGQTRQPRPLLLESLTLARRIELAPMELHATWGLALVDQTDGAAGSAAGHCWSVVERWTQTEDRHYAISPLRWATSFFAEAGDGAGTRTCAAALAQIATDTGQDEAMSALSHALGETALLDGGPEQAAGQFARALTLLQGLDVPFDRAESQRRAAAALAVLGRREEAVEHLVAAHRTARRLGARPLVERLTDRLAALGERAERRLGRRAVAQAASGGLTRREVEVVRLVAMGHTNREIARELFLSPRTVEMHVGSILVKLDCRSRADAARRASELGLLTGVA